MKRELRRLRPQESVAFTNTGSGSTLSGTQTSTNAPDFRSGLARESSAHLVFSENQHSICYPQRDIAATEQETKVWSRLKQQLTFLLRPFLSSVPQGRTCFSPASHRMRQSMRPLCKSTGVVPHVSGFSHRQGGVIIFDASIKILTRGRQILQTPYGSLQKKTVQSISAVASKF